MMRSRDLSKKVLVSLLTMSCVYLGGTCTLPMAEADNYILNAAFRPHNNPLMSHWSEFETLQINGASDSEWQRLMTNYGIVGFSVGDVKNLVMAIDRITVSAFDDQFNIDLGNNNLSIVNSVAGADSLALDNATTKDSIIGSGTLKLGADITSGNGSSGLLSVGYDSNNIGTDRQFTIDTNKLELDGSMTGDAKGHLKGIELVGVNQYGHDAELVITSSTDIKLVKSGIDTTYSPFGIYMQNTVSNINTHLSIQDLNAVIEHKDGVAYGILVQNYNFQPTVPKTNNTGILDFNGAVKTDVSGKLMAIGSFISADGVNNNWITNFAKTTQLTATSSDGEAYTLYASAKSQSGIDQHFQNNTVLTSIGRGDSTGIYTVSKDGSNINIKFDKQTEINVTSGQGEANAVYNLVQGANAVSWVNFQNGLSVVHDASADKGGSILLAGVIGGTVDNSLNVKNNINVNGAVKFVTNGGTKDYVATAAGGGAAVNVNQSGGSLVQGIGHLQAQDGGKVNWKMDTAGSFLTGASYISNEGEVNLDISNSSIWSVAGTSSVTDLVLNTSLVDMRADNNAYSKLTAENLQGSGGIIKQDIDVRSMESDKVLVTGDFSGSQALDIYQKDNYVPVNSSCEGVGLVLASVNGNGTFTAQDREGTLFRTHYDLASQNSATAGFTTDWYLKGIEVNSETTSVKSIMSAGLLNYHTWRTENDKLLQRMGELRHNGEEEQGAWFRVKGSKIGRDGKFGFENKYTAYELGYDQVMKKTADKTRYQGAAISYTDGSSSYSKGSGDNSSKSISFYNTEIGSKGHYLDLVFKISNMDNDFTVYDTNSNKITGDFNNTGVSLSAEYGRKNDLSGGWYIEPQAQFTLGYLGGDRYATSNGIEVNQSGIKSAVGRIGFNIGKEVGNKGMVYAKANLLHEFGGGYDVTMRDSTGRVKISDSFNDTWFEYGIGAAFATGKSSHLYFDVERSTGSDFTKDWQWNVGARWNF